jgi:hypothetical protein
MVGPAQGTSTEGRPSLRPLALLVGALAAAWLAAIVLIAIQLT